MMVLHIINLFHSSLCGPLAVSISFVQNFHVLNASLIQVVLFCLQVLHRFLDYYSTFDWDNYCISINGPVAISSLPEIVGRLL